MNQNYFTSFRELFVREFESNITDFHLLYHCEKYWGSNWDNNQKEMHSWVTIISKNMNCRINTKLVYWWWIYNLFDSVRNGGKDSLKLVFLPVSKPRQMNSIFTINRSILYIYNIVSNISCRFLCKIEMQYLPIFLLDFLYRCS